MDKSKVILAMYDIRGKQAYIYKSTKMKEIVGASLIIRDCFIDYLFPAAEQVTVERNGEMRKSSGIYSYRVGKNGEGKYYYKKPDLEHDRFSEENFRKHLEEGYLGEVVYDGGGNFFVLFENVDVYREVNKRFYAAVLRATYSLKVLTSYIEGVDFENYREDQRKLYQVHRKNEQRECAIHPVNALPIVQVDPKSSLPLATKWKPDWAKKEESVKVTLESKAKYDKYGRSVDENVEGARILDDMITKKGEDSHLAVIYIDGNSMGAKVQKATEGCQSYEESVGKLRGFSEKIQKEYIDDPIAKIDQYLDAKNDKRRFVIYAGDEITFVCNVNEAWSVVNEYFDALNPEGSDSGAGKNGDVNTSCAGIALFQSHAPYAEAYRIAEECCESGKKLMKALKLENACFLDYHLCQGAIGISLEAIREHEGTAELAVPWLLKIFDKEESGKWKTADGKPIPGKDEIETVRGLLNMIARSNGKDLLLTAKEGDEAFRMEMERIKAHTQTEDLEKLLSKMIEESDVYRPLIYRMMLVYDWWFRGEEKAE